MKPKLVACGAAVFVIASVLAPPDMISQLMLGVGAALLCTVPLWFLAQCGFAKSASPSIHTVICILMALVVVLSAYCYQLRISVRGKSQHIEELWDRVEAAEAVADVNTPEGTAGGGSLKSEGLGDGERANALVPAVSVSHPQASAALRLEAATRPPIPKGD